ncbi:hypothetical protein LOC619574, isoform CRA_a [Rattus norvegicus]|uniref:Secreted protein n=1 Tax=Rattus norvegicus TaxID=10116 RepID=A6HLN4_RAT|nr:hypothetical protein LOC619574, isoform CRA_a [Rattus norvegicus]
MPGHRTLREIRVLLTTLFLLRQLCLRSQHCCSTAGMEGSPNPTREEAATGGKVTSFGFWHPAVFKTWELLYRN